MTADLRPPLPTEAAGLLPLDAAFRQTLDADLEGLGIVLTRGQRDAIEAHAQLLLAWNESINLTALRGPEQVARHHVIDSLTAVALLRGFHPAGRLDGGWTLLDLGSGGGYPGLPLAMVAGARALALVDSVGKKARFLRVAAAAATAGLAAADERAPRVQVLAERGEALARLHEHRERWDVVTARAVGTLAELVELALPLLRVGGRLIAWKRDAGLIDERGPARVMLRALQSSPRALEVHRVPLTALADHRLVVITKSAQTPARFPRSVVERRRAAPT
ncbi:MAG: 16S rRNA (guanine(527)-N(7))-methyltransferase RsmG [Chloroflexi bacterium]|nr:16S rRNA (guanine(527)-N(7))-methyltransferase RsmG [Chloroflexota bacterium]